MSIILPISGFHYHHHLPNRPKSKVIISASLDGAVKGESRKNIQSNYEETKERIEKMFYKVELSVSAYDTAWVAMVPSLATPNIPHFPQCLNWILRNQLHDGSWGINPHEPALGKDVLSSTLACVLSLKKWGVGEELMNKGVHYIQSNFEYAMDGKQASSIEFEMIFPSMIEQARDLTLNLPLESAHLSSLFMKRDLELKRITESKFPGSEAYVAYISEAMGKFIDKETIMKYQRKNGSLFNSPSSTAAASTRHLDSNFLNYLQSVLDHSGNAVPTMYPLDIYARLCMIDALVRTGIDHHFAAEIQNVLETTYRCWEEEKEEVFLDASTCAMAFRLLRVNGYEVSPGPLAQYATKENYLGSLPGLLNDIKAVLELYRASEVITRPDESVLKKINGWSRPFLIQNCLDNSLQSENLKSRIRQEVNDALKFPSYACLDRLENRRYINIYGSGNSGTVLKTSYNCMNFCNKEIVKLASEDFNCNQMDLREEFIYFERWVSENRLDELQFARTVVRNMYFSAATIFVSPGLSDARLAWSKISLLTVFVDDFFDVKCSRDELEKFIYLVEKWDLNLATDSYSKDSRILFSALHRATTEIAEAAKKYQKRDVTRHLIDVWLNVVRAMFKEAEWRWNGCLPTVDDYLKNGSVSIVTECIVLHTLFFVGPSISEEAINSVEYHNLNKILGTMGRLRNDIATFEKEFKEGTLNGLTLWMAHVANSTKEMVMRESMEMVDSMRMELLQLVLQQDTEVPNACKQVFWKMSKSLHVFYASANQVGSIPDDDLVDLVEVMSLVDSVLYEPVSVD